MYQNTSFYRMNDAQPTRGCIVDPVYQLNRLASVAWCQNAEYIEGMRCKNVSKSYLWDVECVDVIDNHDMR